MHQCSRQQSLLHHRADWAALRSSGIPAHTLAPQVLNLPEAARYRFTKAAFEGSTHYVLVRA